MIMNQVPDEKIDVIIPVHNRADFIEESIQSILRQSLLPSKIIVVDDGSTDETEAIVEKVALSSPNVEIQYVKKEYGGPSSARNFGIQRSSGNYLAFLDADDTWRPLKLQLQMDVFKKSNLKKLGVVYCDYEIMDHAGNLLNMPRFRLNPAIRGDIYKDLLAANLIASSASGVIIKKECFEQAGFFDENLPTCEDWDMWLRIAKFYEYDYVDLPLSLIRRHTSNLSRDNDQMLIGKILMLNKIADSTAVPGVTLRILQNEIAICTREQYAKGNCINFFNYMNENLQKYF